MKNIILIILILVPTLAWSQTTPLPPPATPGTYGVKLLWNHTDPVVTGFKMYYGISPTALDSSVDALKVPYTTGGVTGTYQYVMTQTGSPFTKDQDYCWAVTAYKIVNAKLFESQKSNIVCGTYLEIPDPPTGIKIQVSVAVTIGG